MNDDAPEQGPATTPGWLDDPFSRDGQRWWDGHQWTGRTRSPEVASAQGPARHRGQTRPVASSDSALPPTTTDPLSRVRPYALVIVGVLATFLLVGLLAPSAEESGVVALGSRRAAYWACVDLVDRQLPPNVTADFGGDSSATVRQSGQTWQVAATVGLDAGNGQVRRTWECTVVHDDGTWRGTAALE